MLKHSLMKNALDLFRRITLSVLMGISLAALGGHAQAQTPNSPPAGYQLCAAEGQRCNFSGAAQVVYGARTTWTSPRSFTGGVACSNATFGDPLRQVVKACYVKATPTPTPTPTPNLPPSGYTLCATEGQRCNFNGTANVVYGARSTWTSPRSFTGGVTCSNASFGDPLVRVEKACYYNAAPAPSPLTATRVSGPAPLAVQIDATSLGAFNDVYEFDFGDSASGLWAVSGLPKNTQRGGAIAAHVYDLPGTYTVRVGGSTLTVTVHNPDTVFAGVNTVCVSTSASYSGCPAGALTQTTLPTTYANKRVLLRRGESFGAITPRATDSGFQVGAFGSGAKPNVAGIFTGTPAAGGTVTSDWTVMDLSIGTGAVSIDASTARFLLYRNDIVRYGDTVAMVNIGTAAGYYQSHGHQAIQWPREVFLVENNLQGTISTRETSPGVVAMGYFLKSAILGNTMDRAYEHTMRIWAASKTIIAHNALGGNHRAEADGIGMRHALKIHSGGIQSFTDQVSTSLAPASSQVVVANNILGSPTFPGSWISGVGPQNSDAGTIEGLEDFVIENNYFVHGPHTSSDVQLRGRRMTARGNRVSGEGPAHIVRNGSNYDPGLAAWDGPYFIGN